MTPERLSARRAEFESHVWNHMDDMFQASFDLKSPLERNVLDRLVTVLEAMKLPDADAAVADVLWNQAHEDPDYLLVVLQLVGLTRTKPRSDLNVPLRDIGARTPSDVRKFASEQELWKIAGPYFATRVRTVFASLIGLETKELFASLEALNQSTWPGYIRQERAKRSGGYAEQRAAIVLKALGIEFEPIGKADNGLTADVTIAGESFDLVIPNARHPRLCIISMLHSSNIGQYGESKASDAPKAKSALQTLPTKPELVVLADGVGFHSNIAGLNNLLTNADEFFQLATVWKLAVKAADAVGAKLIAVLPDEDAHTEFLKGYSGTVSVLEKVDDVTGWVEAGEAYLRREA